MLDNKLSVIYFIKFYLKKIIKNIINIENYSNKNRNFNSKAFEQNFLQLEKKENYKSLLLICLDGFELYFFYIWLIAFYSLKGKNLKIKIVTTKKNIFLNKVIQKLKIDFFIIEELLSKNIKINKNLLSKINNLDNFNDFYEFKYDGFDVGMMIISNFCRIHKVGFVNYNSKLQKNILKKTIIKFITEYEIIKKEDFFKDIKIAFTFEKNLFHYLHFFIFAVKKNIDLVHWSGSNLDEKTFILKRYSKKNIYDHHSSISKKLWSEIKNISSNKIISRNKIIFKNRFSGNYAPFAINLIECTKNVNYNIKKQNNKLNCIIFSHILHDTLYFFGKEFYNSYSHWLVSTIKIASKNTKVNWYIKIHPSNLYRGEFKKGFSKEEDIIRQEIKHIPNHIKFIYPDTKINPLAWMNFADVGITVRGTSGLEMAVLGKKVITCGKNRYENKGFTIDPKNKNQYEKMLLNLPRIKKLNSKSYMRANLFYNYIFEKKGFKCDFLYTNNKKKSFNWSDINFKINKNFRNSKNLKKLRKFLLSRNELEYIN